MDAMERILTGTNSSHSRLNRYSETNLFPRTKYHTSKSGETLPVRTRSARALQPGKDLQRGWHAQTPNWKEKVRIHPGWRRFLYFVYNDEIVIVDPRTMRIVNVLPV